MGSMVGTVLDDRYRVTGEIAQGGMGAVYRGERLKLGRVVAIKFLLGWTSTDEARQRFEREAQAMGKLHHPNVVTVTDFGVHDGTPYLVMDFVKGRPLDELIADGPLPPARAMAIAEAVLAGLAHAHDEGIIHRDIKPANIMVHEAEGFADEVRILDFGVAKMHASDAGNLTAGMAIGTPSYMAPEQTAPVKLDVRADIYSVGVLLHHMLTGAKPFDHDDKLELLRMQCEDPRPPLEVADAPAGLEAVVHKAMAIDRDARYQTAAEMATALREVTTGRAETPPPVADEVDDDAATIALEAVPEPVMVAASTVRTINDQNRRWWIIGGAGGAFLILVLALLASGGGDDEPTRPAPSDKADRGDEPLVLDDIIALAEKDNRAGAKALEGLAREYPEDARIQYELGKTYFRRPWWPKGLEAYGRAIELDFELREDEALIRDVLRALGSDSSHRRAEAFIVEVLGKAALPYLDELAEKTSNKTVRGRAERTSRRIREN